jgi:hypothetical protein
VAETNFSNPVLISPWPSPNQPPTGSCDTQKQKKANLSGPYSVPLYPVSSRTESKLLRWAFDFWECLDCGFQLYTNWMWPPSGTPQSEIHLRGTAYTHIPFPLQACLWWPSWTVSILPSGCEPFIWPAPLEGSAVPQRWATSCMLLFFYGK